MKKVMIKKTISAILVTCLTISMLGCGKKAPDVASEEKITIKWMGIPYFAACDEGTYSEQLLEKQFNVEIKPVFLDEEAYKAKKPMMMASGDIPDIIYELDPIYMQSDAKQRFLSEVPYDDLLNSTPNIVKEINKVAPEAWLYSYYEGKNYGLPNLNYGGNKPDSGMWRLDWLHNVGINKIPETVEEMHSAFTKFVNDDPDKNGKKDTYALSGDLKSWHYTFSEIFGAYDILPFNWVERNGKVVYGGTQPEIKEVLKVLVDWYKEGLITPDFITDETGKGILDKFKNGSIGYVNVGGMSFSNFDEVNPESCISVIKKISPAAQTAVAPLPKGPNGKSGNFVWGEAGHIISLGKQVAQQPEKMKKIYQIFEHMYDNQDFSSLLAFGEEGTHYVFKDPNVGGIKYKPELSDVRQRIKLLLGLGAGPSFFGVIPVTQATKDKFTSKAVLEHMNKYSDSNLGQKDVFLKPDVVKSSEKYLENLRNKQLVYFANIIRGEKSVDEYNKFISEFYSMGGTELEANANDLYDTRKEIYSKVKIQ